MKALTETFTVLALTVTVAMVVALVIKGITVILGRRDAAGAAGAPGLPHAPVTQPRRDEGPPAEHVAAIAAAVATIIDGGRVVHIEPTRSGTGWSAAGRQSHHASHNLGPRRSTPHTRHETA